MARAREVGVVVRRRRRVVLLRWRCLGRLLEACTKGGLFFANLGAAKLKVPSPASANQRRPAKMGGRLPSPPSTSYSTPPPLTLGDIPPSQNALHTHAHTHWEAGGSARFASSHHRLTCHEASLSLLFPLFFQEPPFPSAPQLILFTGSPRPACQP